MQVHRRHTLVLTLAATSAAGWLPVALAQAARTPLLMEGKKTLYQRVLTRPGATLAAAPGGAGGKPLEPFTVFYVYERTSGSGKPALLVGAGADGKTQGYIAEEDAVPWKHAMAVTFSLRTNRDRVLFFRDRDALVKFIDGPKPGEESQRLLAQIKTAQGKLGPSHAVVAAEPETYVDASKQFYLLPVLDAATVPLKNGFNSRVLKVASITVDGPGTAPAKPAPAPAVDAGIVNFNSALVFVIDATSSMQPYIDRTRNAMAEVLKRAEEAKIMNRIRFGLVSYQDDPAKTAGVEYLYKVHADPARPTTRAEFMSALAGVKAAKASTRAYAEDGYAALDAALQKFDWDSYGGRYVVYVTDASSREGASPLASQHPSTEELNTYAQAHRIAIYAVHLKTPEGKADHGIAQEQYRRLTRFAGVTPNYYPIEAGDPARFESQIGDFVKQLVEQVRNPSALVDPPPAAPANGTAGTMAANTALVGRAMVLAYLGRQQATKAPPMYEAWASDLDVNNGAIKTLSTCVLLNKNQLSDLQATLRNIVRAGQQGQVDPGSFFNELRSAAVTMGRDPSRIGQGKSKNLEQTGLMGEYLDGLPYRSQLMELDLEKWANSPLSRQQSVLDGIKSKIVLYQRFHDDVNKWVALNPGASDGEKVYPLPLDALP